MYVQKKYIIFFCTQRAKNISNSINSNFKIPISISIEKKK